MTPNGAAPGDQGPLAAVITTHKDRGRIRIDFKKNLRWVEMTADDALALASALVDRVLVLEGRKPAGG